MNTFFPKLQLKQFYSTSSWTNFLEREDILKDDILKFLDYFDSLSDDPSAVSVVVLTTYIIWSKRNIHWEADIQNKKAHRIARNSKRAAAELPLTYPTYHLL